MPDQTIAVGATQEGSSEKQMDQEMHVLDHRPRHGEPLWCDSPDWRKQLEEMRLSDADKDRVEEFATQGYLIVKNAIPEQLTSEARMAYDSLMDQSKLLREAAVRDRRLPNFHKYSEAGKRVFSRSREALKFQDLLFGYRSSVYTSLYFKHGTQQSIDRDIPVFCTQPKEFYFGVWCALEDANETNGALRAIPGGHRLHTVDPFALAARVTNDPSSIHPSDSPLWSMYQEAVHRECQAHELKEISIEMEEGDVLIWHPMLPHGGGKILDESATRHSMVYHVVPEGTPVYQMDVFFNRNRQDEPDLASWEYDTFEGRLFVKR